MKNRVIIIASLAFSVHALNASDWESATDPWAPRALSDAERIRQDDTNLLMALRNALRNIDLLEKQLTVASRKLKEENFKAAALREAKINLESGRGNYDTQTYNSISKKLANQEAPNYKTWEKAYDKERDLRWDRYVKSGSVKVKPKFSRSGQYGLGQRFKNWVSSWYK